MTDQPLNPQFTFADNTPRRNQTGGIWKVVFEQP